MDELVKTMVSQAPAVAILLYIALRLDARLAALQDAVIEFLEAEQQAAHHYGVPPSDDVVKRKRVKSDF